MAVKLHIHAVRAWFALNALVALLPPLHWAVGSSTLTVLGLPVSLLYFVGVSLSLTLNIVYAYWQERQHGELS